MKYKIALILGLFAVAPMQITQAQDVLNVVDSEVTSVNELVFTEGPAYHRDGISSTISVALENRYAQASQLRGWLCRVLALISMGGMEQLDSV